MAFNFDTKNTLVSKTFRLASFPLFKYADGLSRLCLGLFFLSLLLIIFYFFGFVSESTALKMPVLFFILLLFFTESHLFSELKIKIPKKTISISEALLKPDSFNLAEFLSLESCQIVEYSVRLCSKRKLAEVSSEALFYAALEKNRDIQIIIFRLGLDDKKLLVDLKNCLEKQSRQNKFQLAFDQSFQKTITDAAVLSEERGHQTIGPKDILVSLAKNNKFFKEILLNDELKEKDIEQITLWLDFLEETIKESKKFWTKENLSRFGSIGKDFASGFTVTLDQFSIDWRRFVKKNILNEIIGHEKEIGDLEVILSKSDLSNALVIGEEGVGRKSIVQALAKRCYLGTGLPDLVDKRVVEIDMVALLSQIQNQEEMEITLDRIFQEALAAGNVILVIDRIDNYVTQKVQKPGEVDISVILSKYLAMPNFHFVGITSFDGLHRKLEQNPAFLEYFRKIEVSEISELETIRILQNLALILEQRYKIIIIYPAIREIINLTARYMPSTPFPKKAIDVLEEASVVVRSQKEKVVLPRHIAKIISDKTQIPIGKLEFKERSVLMNLEKLIHQRIINQEEAVRGVSVAMRRARSGISSKKRPMGTFLFLGPTGVGKTETSKVLADIYFGGEKRMIRLDMSEFQIVSDIPRLIGGTSQIEQPGLLTTPVRENPFSMILLDEIEKAHPNILNLFLQVFDEGHITDGQGRKVIFANTIIICTSNAGAPLIFKAIEEGKKIEEKILMGSLFEQGIFKPEFINRFDAVVVFHPLTRENLMDIAQLMLSDLAKSLKEKEIDLIVTESLKEKIVDISYKPEFGAREMRRTLQNKVENEIAQALLDESVVKGDKIEVNPENFKIIKIA